MSQARAEPLTSELSKLASYEFFVQAYPSIRQQDSSASPYETAFPDITRSGSIKKMRRRQVSLLPSKLIVTPDCPKG
jgi:hypothetical protein